MLPQFLNIEDSELIEDDSRDKAPYESQEKEQGSILWPS